MADPSGPPGSGERTGLPRWAKVLVITVVMLAMLVLAVMVVGGGGEHGPGRHDNDGGTPSSGVPNGHTPPFGHG